MPQGTLANLANSAFVRTPPAYAERIVRSLLSFPAGMATNVLDPTAGEGDLLVPCLDIPTARLYGVEISAERTAVARTRLSHHAELVTSAFEGVTIPKGCMSLVLANPPYFFQDGKRAEYRIIADAGLLLMPGGVHGRHHPGSFSLGWHHDQPLVPLVRPRAHLEVSRPHLLVVVGVVVVGDG